MALITGTFGISANSNNALTLNRTELASLISDTYWAQTDNWKKVVVRYTYLGQKVDVAFNGQTGSGSARFPARTLTGVWKIHSITIVDFAKADYFMSQGQVPSLISYNITLSGGISYEPVITGPTVMYTRDFTNPNTLQSGIETLSWADTATFPTLANGEVTIPSKSNAASYVLKLNQLSLGLTSGVAYKMKIYLSDYAAGWADGNFYLWMVAHTASVSFTDSQLAAAFALGYLEYAFTAGPGLPQYGSLQPGDFRIAINGANDGTNGIIKFNKIEIITA